jgi:hypothetical protein
MEEDEDQVVGTTVFSCRNGKSVLDSHGIPTAPSHAYH